MVQHAVWSGLIGRFLCCALVVSAAGCGGGSSGATSEAPQAPQTSQAPQAPQILAPSISGTPTTQAQVGRLYSFQPTVSNSSGGTVGFSIQNKPGWANFSVATGQLTGTPGSSDVGTDANIQISATNGTATASLPSFTITVGQGGTVTLNWQAPTANTDGSPLTDLAGYTIDYGSSSSAMNQSVTLANPATTTYTVQNLTSGIWYFAIIAFRSDGAQSALSNVVSTTVQ